MSEIYASLVVDTSAWLQNLEFMKSIANEANSKCVELVVPQAVITELDKIKDREKMQPLGLAARSAINWISSSLVEQDPREFQVLRGETREESRQNASQALNNDDRILMCALNMKRQRFTVLVSADTNLLNRALIDGLDTLSLLSWNASAEETVSLIANHAQNVMLPEYIPQDSEPKQVKPASKPVNQRTIKKNLHLFANLPDPVCVDEDLQTRLVSNIVLLVDFHLHQIYTPAELDALYRPGNSTAAVARIIKSFSFDFEDICGKNIVQWFLNVVKSDVIDTEYVRVHLVLLRALANDDIRYINAIKGLPQPTLEQHDDIMQVDSFLPSDLAQANVEC